MKPLALDLFTGRGGWAEGLLAAGFDVVGIDVEPRPDGYPEAARHVQADVRHVDGALYRGAHVVVASPPCTGFSLINPKRKMGQTPTPEDFRLVCEALRVIAEAEPRWWAIENVQGAMRPFEPIMGAPRQIVGRYFLWGNFPPIRPTRTPGTKGWDAKGRNINSRRSPALRARIPAELAVPFARAVAAQRVLL